MFGKAFGLAMTAGLSCLVGLAVPGASDIAHAGNTGSIKISSQSGSHRRAMVNVSKSLVIDLPRDVGDMLVSNPKVADAVLRQKRRAYIIGNMVGRTNIFFFDKAGRQILALDLGVSIDVRAIERTIRRFVPTSRITVEALNDNLILRGTADSPADAHKAVQIAARAIGTPISSSEQIRSKQLASTATSDKVLNYITVRGSDQVNLQVTVAEVQRTVLKQLGVDLTATLNSGNFATAVLSQNPFSVAGAVLNGSGASTTWSSGGNSVRGTLRLMDRSGVMRVLAKPNLSAISGETAKFTAGGEFPVPTNRSEEAGKVTIGFEFKPFGVSLAFRPVVMSAGRISLKVSTEVSELTDANSFTLGGTTPLRIPGLKVRRADTTVELPSGGSIVIAGLLQNDVRQVINGIPGLRKLPVLGALFRSRDYMREETELMIMVTPYIVKPVARKNLARPDDNYHAAGDLETIFLNKLNRKYGVRGGKPAGTYRGRVGFIID